MKALAPHDELLNLVSILYRQRSIGRNPLDSSDQPVDSFDIRMNRPEAERPGPIVFRDASELRSGLERSRDQNLDQVAEFAASCGAFMRLLKTPGVVMIERLQKSPVRLVQILHQRGSALILGFQKCKNRFAVMKLPLRLFHHLNDCRGSPRLYSVSVSSEGGDQRCCCTRGRVVTSAHLWLVGGGYLESDGLSRSRTFSAGRIAWRATNFFSLIHRLISTLAFRRKTRAAYSAKSKINTHQRGVSQANQYQENAVADKSFCLENRHRIPRHRKIESTRVTRAAQNVGLPPSWQTLLFAQIQIRFRLGGLPECEASAHFMYACKENDQSHHAPAVDHRRISVNFRCHNNSVFGIRNAPCSLGW